MWLERSFQGDMYEKRWDRKGGGLHDSVEHTRAAGSTECVVTVPRVKCRVIVTALFWGSSFVNEDTRQLGV